jgi:hypothetical protein
LHNREPVVDHRSEAIEVAFALGRLSAERRNLLGILARAHEIETEVGFETLLLKIERNKAPADQMRQRSADDGVDDCRPNEIAGNVVASTEQMQRRLLGKRPQNDDERTEADDCIQ